MAIPVTRAREIETEEEIQRIYNWMDDIQLSRPRRNIARDFADAVLLAEVLHQYFPKLVELHNYSQANSQAQKLYNWNTLNKKVLKKVGCQLHPDDIDDIIRAVPGAVEKILVLVQHHMARYKRECDRRGKENVAGVDGGGVAGGMAGGGGNNSNNPGGVSNTKPPLKLGQGAGAAGSRGNLGAGRDAHDSRPESPPRNLNTPKQPYYQPNYQGGQHIDRSSYQNVSGDSAHGMEQELTVAELKETILIMTEKIKKLEQLVRIKDAKLAALQNKVENMVGR